MRRYGKYLFLSVLAVGLTALVAFSIQAGTAEAKRGSDGKSLQYKVEASDGMLIRKVTGPVTSYVDGIPAEPVDSFIWNGDGIVSIGGSAEVNIDPVANTGEIEAKWTDEDGNEWKYRQTVFMPPPHPTGLVVGPSASDTQLIEGDPVTTNVYLHGDTGAGGPILPTVFNLLATWGPAAVTLNGEPFENTFDGPVPNWAGHTMTTVGVRNEDGQVLATDGDGFKIFDMSQAANGVVYDDEVVFHLVFHDAPGPEMTDNVPPPLSFFYHVTFQDVKVEIN
jgi:hypothetical protein